MKGGEISQVHVPVIVGVARGEVKLHLEHACRRMDVPGSGRGENLDKRPRILFALGDTIGEVRRKLAAPLGDEEVPIIVPAKRAGIDLVGGKQPADTRNRQVRGLIELQDCVVERIARIRVLRSHEDIARSGGVSGPGHQPYRRYQPGGNEVVNIGAGQAIIFKDEVVDATGRVEMAVRSVDHGVGPTETSRIVTVLKNDAAPVDKRTDETAGCSVELEDPVEFVEVAQGLRTREQQIPVWFEQNSLRCVQSLRAGANEGIQEPAGPDVVLVDRVIIPAHHQQGPSYRMQGHAARSADVGDMHAQEIAGGCVVAHHGVLVITACGITFDAADQQIFRTDVAA